MFEADYFWQLTYGNASGLALVDPTVGPITYAELRAECAAATVIFDSHARRLGVDRLLVGIEICSSSPMIAVYLAALAAGHVVLLGAPGTFAPGSDQRDIFAPNIVIAMAGNKCSFMPISDKPADLHADVKLLLSTSGTTGDPKLVRLSAENLQSNAAAIAQYLGLRPDDRAVTTLPLHYIFGLSVLHAHLQAGACTVLTDMSVTDPEFAPFFALSRGTNISVVPHQIDLLFANGFWSDSLPGLRHIAQAGGKLSPSKVQEMAGLARRGNWSFFVMYGQTEASPRMAYLPPDAAEAYPDTVGQPIPGGRFVIRDEAGQPITQSQTPGDLIYFGPNVMMGYAMSRGDLAHPRDTFELATGDVAEFTPEGMIKIVGRKARFVKLFGLRISLDQVETLLRSSGVECFAVAVDDQLALLLPNLHAQDTARDMVANAYGLPKATVKTVILDHVPVLPSGKPDMKSLAFLAKDALQTQTSTADQTTTIRSVMEDATRRSNLPLDESYTSLGGDSLGYLQVQIFLEGYLGRPLPGWENMTLRQLQALTPAKDNAAAFWSYLDMDVALRVVSIILIILVHLGRMPVGGGTWVLLLLMGYSFARFQRPRLIEKQFRAVLLRMLHPILLLYAVLLLAYQMVRGDISPLYLLLLGNSVPTGQGTVLTVYWFVSLYAQVVAVLVALFCYAPFRQWQMRNPWLSSCFAFGIATCIAIAALLLLPDPFPSDAYPGILGNPVAARSLEVCLPIAILGMMIQSAHTTIQRIVTLCCLIITCVIFPETFVSQPFILAAGGILLIFIKAIPMPTAAVRLISVMAASTLFVFLLHNLVVHLVRTGTPIMALIGLPASVVLVVPASFVLGHYAKLVFEAGDRAVLSWWQSRHRDKA